MTTIQLRKKIHDIVDHADDRLLKMIYAFSKEYDSETNDWLLKEDEIAYTRINEMKSGKVKGLSLDEVVKKAKSSLKK